MGLIKIYETYFDDKFKEMMDSIKSEVDIYMYSLTDDYQIDSSEDYINYKGSEGIELIYNNIKIDSDNYDSFIEKLIKISKILDRDFNIMLRGIQVTNPKYWLDSGTIRHSLVNSYKKPGERLFGNIQEVTLNIIFKIKSETLSTLY